MTNYQCHPNTKYFPRHLYLSSYGEDCSQAIIHCYCLRHTPLVKVVKYLLIGTVKKKLCHKFPHSQVVASPLIFYYLVYVMSWEYNNWTPMEKGAHRVLVASPWTIKKIDLGVFELWVMINNIQLILYFNHYIILENHKQILYVSLG